MKRFLCGLVAVFLVPVLARGQRPADGPSVNVRFSGTRAQTVAGTCCFYLTGGAADAALPIFPRLSAVVDLTGQTTGRVANTSRGLSTITLLAGPRYSIAPSRVLFAGQALFGAARGFDADFTSGARTADTATAFSMALGGFAEYRLTQSIRLRIVQVDYLQTNLPNGSDNRQRNIRLGAGVTFTVHLPNARR